MNVIQLWKIWRAAKKVTDALKEENNMNGDTPRGIFTTEFWLIAIPNIIIVIEAMRGTIPDKYQLLILAVANGLYAFARAYAKKV